MAAITTAPASTFTRAVLPKGQSVITSAAPVLGLPQLGVRGGRVRCSAVPEKAAGHGKAAGAALLAATTSVMSSPALALVDERLSGEGTGLPFGLSNNLLGWILFGVFGVIWSFYFVYTASLEEDEESGLSL